MGDPSKLPAIPSYQIWDGEKFSLRKFEYKGRTYRIVGYDITENLHFVKCETTGEFKAKDESWLRSVFLDGEKPESEERVNEKTVYNQNQTNLFS